MAMKSEMDSIYTNDTWELVSLSVNKKPLPCKWVYWYKYVYKSEHAKYKARRVVKGFKQEKGINYDEMFSPVVKMMNVQSYGLELERWMWRRLSYMEMYTNTLYVSINWLHSDGGRSSHLLYVVWEFDADITTTHSRSNSIPSSSWSTLCARIISISCLRCVHEEDSGPLIIFA